MSVIRSERNEASSLIIFNAINIYDYAKLHLRNIEKKFNNEKASIIESCDKLIEKTLLAYKIEISNEHEYQLVKDCLVEMACWLEKIDIMLTIIRNDNGIEDRILIPWEVLIDKELELIKKKHTQSDNILNKLLNN